MSKKGKFHKSSHERLLLQDEIFVTDRGHYYYNHEDRQLKSYINIQGVTFNFSQEFLYYIGHRGNNSEFDFRASGAYIFRPQSQEPTKLPKADNVKVQEGESRVHDMNFRVDSKADENLSK